MLKNIKEPVRLREKPLKNGVKSLYLDIYQDGLRHYEYLKLYINPGNDPLTKAKNKASLDAARTIQAKRLVEIQSGVANIITAEKRKIRFVDYFNEYYNNRPNLSDRVRKKSQYVLSRWISFAGEDVLLNKITPEMLVEFGTYLTSVHNLFRKRKVKIYPGPGRAGGFISTEDAEEILWELACHQKKKYSQISKETGIQVSTIAHILLRLKNDGKQHPLSEATIKSYFKMVTSVINRASSKGLIAVNPVAALDAKERPQGKSPERVYLTMDEVVRLANTDCPLDVLKRSFLFSCFTGLRLSDVMALTWKKVDENRVGTTMQKTKTAIYIPLSENAKKWLPERETSQPDELVFKKFPTPNTLARYLNKWVENAGISKHVTFHIARHTFATLSLEYGADLYTISKLLGHQRVTTTQIYAKVVDKKKEEAVNLIPTI